MSTTTSAPPRLLNTVVPEPEHHDDLQHLLDQLVQDTETSYGVVFGTHGLHLLRTGNLDQIGAERVTAVLTNVLVLSRGVGKLTDSGEAEAIVIRYESGALVLAPLGASFGLGLFTEDVGEVRQTAHAITRFTSQAEHLLPQDDLVSQAPSLPRREVSR